MKPSIWSSLLTWIGLLGLTVVSPNLFATDLILLSQHVITMTDTQTARGTPQAIAVSDGKISWIGAHEDIDNVLTADTTVIDLGTQALLPGFIDAHGHATFTALSTNLANTSSPPGMNLSKIPAVSL